jgi:hypothetical protein
VVELAFRLTVGLDGVRARGRSSGQSLEFRTRPCEAGFERAEGNVERSCRCEVVQSRQVAQADDVLLGWAKLRDTGRERSRVFSTIQLIRDRDRDVWNRFGRGEAREPRRVPACRPTLVTGDVRGDG